MMPGLEHEHFAEAAIERRNNLAHTGFSEDPVTEKFLQHTFERLPAVPVERDVQNAVAEGLPRPSKEVVPHGGKDLGTAMHVEVADFTG